MRCQHYVQLLLMCTSFKKEFNVEEEWNQQMNIIIIFLGKNLVDLLDILLSLEHTSPSSYFNEINHFYQLVNLI